jgi:hypothetical protein
LHTHEKRRRLRAILAATIASVASLGAFAALGGVGFAQTGIGLAQYQYGKKVTICHKGKVTITISVNALPAHLAHDDKVGTCAAVQAAELKAAKLKAAKLKAAKLKAAKAKVGNAKAAKAKAKHDAKGKPAATQTSTVQQGHDGGNAGGKGKSSGNAGNAGGKGKSSGNAGNAGGNGSGHSKGKK